MATNLYNVFSVEKDTTVVIISHARPDGDAVCSSLGLAEYFRLRGNKTIIINDDAFIGYDEWMENHEVHNTLDVLNDLTNYEIIVVDCSHPERIAGNNISEEEIRTLITSDIRVTNIDHHGDNTFFGDVTILGTQWASTTHIIGDILFNKLDIPTDNWIAECLYFGLLTDTGGLSFGNLSAQTFNMIATFATAGVDIPKLNLRFHKNWDQDQLGMLGDVLDTLQLHYDGRVATMHVSQELFEKYDSEKLIPKAIFGVVNRVKSVEIMIMTFEMPDAGGHRISFRAVGEHNMRELAGNFGGGGHVLASGGYSKCTSSTDVYLKIMDALAKVPTLQ